MFAGRSWDDWIAQYELSHQTPGNRLCHTIGIPLVAVSIILGLLSPAMTGLWPWALGVFVVGWIFQFAGHAIEGKPPEFLSDWRFLFVGLRWWFAKVLGASRK